MDHPPLALAGEIGASRNDTSSLAQAHPADEEAGPATEPGLIPVQAPAVHEQDGDEAQSGASATNDAPAVELPAVPSEDSEGGEGDDGGEDSDGEGVGEGDGDDGGDSDGSLEENSDSGGSGGGRKGRRELKSLILPQWSKFVAADESRPRKRVVTDSGLGSAIMPTPYTAAAGYRPKDAPKSTPKTTPRNKHKPASVIKAARSNAPHHRDFAAGSTVEVLDSGVTGTVVEQGSGWVMVRLDGSHASEPKGFRAANLALRQPKARAAAGQAAVRQSLAKAVPKGRGETLSSSSSSSSLSSSTSLASSASSSSVALPATMPQPAAATLSASSLRAVPELPRCFTVESGRTGAVVLRESGAMGPYTAAALATAVASAAEAGGLGATLAALSSGSARGAQKVTAADRGCWARGLPRDTGEPC